MRPFIPMFLLSLAAASAPARALDLPVKGTYGMSVADCQAARADNEGAYVDFSGESAGHGGQGGCDFTAVRKTEPDRWALIGRCFDLDGRKAPKTMILTRKGKFEIDYDGQRYKRCEK